MSYTQKMQRCSRDFKLDFDFCKQTPSNFEIWQHFFQICNEVYIDKIRWEKPYNLMLNGCLRLSINNRLRLTIVSLSDLFRLAGACVINPRISRTCIIQNLAGLEKEPKFARCGLGAIRSVHEVE